MEDKVAYNEEGVEKKGTFWYGEDMTMLALEGEVGELRLSSIRAVSVRAESTKTWPRICMMYFMAFNVGNWAQYEILILHGGVGKSIRLENILELY